MKMDEMLSRIQNKKPCVSFARHHACRTLHPPISNVEREDVDHGLVDPSVDSFGCQLLHSGVEGADSVNEALVQILEVDKLKSVASGR